MQKLNVQFRDKEFFKMNIFPPKANFFLQFLVHILPLADPDPGSQNVADLTNPDSEP